MAAVPGACAAETGCVMVHKGDKTSCQGCISGSVGCDEMPAAAQCLCAFQWHRHAAMRRANELSRYAFFILAGLPTTLFRDAQRPPSHEATPTHMPPLPDWLVATWNRDYIRRAAGADGALGEPDRSTAVRYLQTAAGGHAFDLRTPAEDLVLQKPFTSLEDLTATEQLIALVSDPKVEAFAGVTTAEPHQQKADDQAERWTLRWHGAWLFPPQLGDGDDPLAVLEAVAAGAHETGDVGVASPTAPASRRQPVERWMEHAPDGSYEEDWRLLGAYRRQGAHLAAVRRAGDGCGACWLALLGNTFAFARDVDRAALPAAARNRPIADALADETIPLEARRRLLDCDFCFGTFGQGGRVGGVVERASHPWRRGAALATLVGEDSSRAWEPVRATDAEALRAALGAIQEDHAWACGALREAMDNGQTGVAELLRARGAVPVATT